MSFRNPKAANSVRKQAKKSLRKPSHKLFITNAVLEYIEAESRRSPTTETGGVIAGTGTLGINDIVITAVTGPGPRARRTRYSFARDISYCQDRLDRFGSDSGGLIDYLGEWHKHHEDEPWPSSRDVGTLKSIAKDEHYHVVVPLLLIMGESNDRNSLRVFAVNAAGRLTLLDWDSTEAPEAQA
jgi:integrative and conjugative element protein (TIGR02256 family)